MSTSHNAFKVAPVSFEKQKNSRLSCHLIFNTDKTSFISHLHHGRKAPLILDESPPPSQVITSRIDDNNIKRQCSFSTIVSYQADYVVYTDGSASGGTKNGGAAAVVTRGSPLQPDVVTIIKTKGRTFTSCYEEEAAAM